MENGGETNRNMNYESGDGNAQSAGGSASTTAINDAFLHKDASCTSMIFGIVSILLSGAPLLSIASIVFGALAIHKSKKNKVFALEKGIAENGMNKAGFITGIVGTVFGSFMTLLFTVLLLALLFFTVGTVASIPAETITGIVEGAIEGATAGGALPLS